MASAWGQAWGQAWAATWGPVNYVAPAPTAITFRFTDGTYVAPPRTLVPFVFGTAVPPITYAAHRTLLVF